MMSTTRTRRVTCASTATPSCKILKLDDEIFAEVEGDADSLAGLLLEIKGDFPELHEKIDYQNFTFEIMELEERRISKVKVVVHQPSSDQPTA